VKFTPTERISNAKEMFSLDMTKHFFFLAARYYYFLCNMSFFLLLEKNWGKKKKSLVTISRKYSLGIRMEKKRTQCVQCQSGRQPSRLLTRKQGWLPTSSASGQISNSPPQRNENTSAHSEKPRSMLYPGVQDETIYS